MDNITAAVESSTFVPPLIETQSSKQIQPFYPETTPSSSNNYEEASASDLAGLNKTPPSTFTFHIPFQETPTHHIVDPAGSSSVIFYAEGNVTPTSGQTITERRTKYYMEI